MTRAPERRTPIPESRAARVRRLFDEASLLTASARLEFLRESSRDDESLCSEVMALLAADQTLGAGFLQGAPADDVLPARIGRYAIVRRIGEGGMGSVFEAVQENPRRTVALKVLKGGLVSGDALRRFEYEAQVLADLRHPGIAQVYEAGIHRESGAALAYFAMEFIPDARAITDFARAQALNTTTRLELFVQACDAVQHGHQRGVIHRDLKPSNILVSSNTELGTRSAESPRSGSAFRAPSSALVRVIDFGIARPSERGSAGPPTTAAGQLIGTLPYMSPEQCAGDQRDVDVRSDVYSMGVVLYELVCNQLPLGVEQWNLLEAARVVREEPVRRPSTVTPSVRGDLETIILKCLEKDRTRRYQTVGELARDVRHFLAGEPIEARRDSSFYILRKTVKRYRAAVAVLLAVALLVAGSTIIAWSLMLNAKRSEQRAQANLFDSLVEGAKARREVATAGRRTDAMDALVRAAAIRPDPSLRNEVMTTLAVPDVRQVSLAIPNEGGTPFFSEDMTRCVWAGRDAVIRTIPEGRELARVPATDGTTRRICLSGDRLVRLLDARTGPRVEVWEVNGSTVELLRSCEAPADGDFDVSANGRTLAVGGTVNGICLYDLGSGELTRRIETTGTARHPALNADATRLAWFEPHSGGAELIDISSAAVTSTRVLDDVRINFTLAWSADGSLLAAAQDDLVHLWDTRTEKEVAILRGHQGAVTAAKFTQDTRLLCTCDWEGITIVWDLATQRPLVRLVAASTNMTADGRMLGGRTTEGSGSAPRLYELLCREPYELLSQANVGSSIKGTTGTVDPSGRLAVGGYAGLEGTPDGLQVFDLGAGKFLGRIECGTVQQARFVNTKDGLALFTTGRAGVAKRSVAITGNVARFGPAAQLLGEPRSDHFDISADGTHLAVLVPSRGQMVLMDTTRPESTRRVEILPQGVNVSMSPDGKWAAVCTWHGAGAEVWDFERASVTARPEVGGNANLRFTPDSKWLVVREPASVSVFDVQSWTKAHTTEVSLASFFGFMDDGRVLVGANPRGLCLLDVATLKPIAEFSPPEYFSLCDSPCSIRGRLTVFTWQGAMLQRWDLTQMRSTLATMNLDWQPPSSTPPERTGELRLEVDQ